MQRLFSIRNVVAWLLLSIVSVLSTGANAATKVAFIADTGSGAGFRDVLNLIKDEGAGAVLVQGDFGYDQNTAEQWEQSINDILGSNFPVLGVVGNHENFEWPLYQRYLKDRVNRVGGLSCSGNVGVKASCTFENLKVVQVAPGIRQVPGISPQDNYDNFIRQSFRDDDNRWRVCTWHKNQRAMNAYSKGNSTGWSVFDACLDVGAMIAMGHAHTYSRTYLMDDFRTQSVAHRQSDMVLESGKSIAVVSGLGGRDIRPQENNGDWFASIYTRTQGAEFGALFCTFERDTAGCYFKSVGGAIPDRFTLRRGNVRGPTDPVSNGPGVFSRTDKSEHWWIAKDSAGNWVRSWVTENCANSLEGSRYSGDWDELNALVTRVSGASPCNGGDTPTSRDRPTTGYVFSRSDANEYRWIDTNSRGQIGSTWIDKRCANNLGGVTERGDWIRLNQLAPALDSLPYPCNADGSTPDNRQAGYVYKRTDKEEYRWIDLDGSGTLGSIWIDQACANRLGGVAARGDWFDLISVAPAFDGIASPCF